MVFYLKKNAYQGCILPQALYFIKRCKRLLTRIIQIEDLILLLFIANFYKKIIGDQKRDQDIKPEKLI